MHTRLVAGMIAAFAVSSAVVSAEQQRQHFEVPPKELPRPKNWRTSSRRFHAEWIQTKRNSLAQCAFSTVARAKAGVSDVRHADL